MTDRSIDELGPVDYIVVEFPAGASNFTGEMAEELVALVDAGTIRVIDVLILTKNADGTVEAVELSDLDELGELQTARGRARRDAGRGGRRQPRRRHGPGQHGRRADLGEPVGRALRIGRAPFRWSADRQRANPDPSDHRRHRGGRSHSTPKEHDMPLRPARVGRVGVIGAPRRQDRGRRRRRHTGPGDRSPRPQSSAQPLSPGAGRRSARSTDPRHHSRSRHAPSNSCTPTNRKQRGQRNAVLTTIP